MERNSTLDDKKSDNERSFTMLKLKICEIFTTCILLPYIGIFVWLMMNKHPLIAFIWVFAAAAVTVTVEDKVKAVIRKLKGK